MTYADFAATSPLTEVAKQAWLTAQDHIGNASATHTYGRAARSLLEDARETIASVMKVEPAEVIFTSGGTEADNLAVAGIASRGTIITSAIEHPAVRDAAELHAHRYGHQHRVVPVTSDGVIDLDAFRDLLDAQVAGVSIMAANNETGVIQPVDQIADLIQAQAPRAVLHTDAVQATGWIDIDAEAVSISGHKLGAPVGTGVLIAPRDFPLVALEAGGGQERKVRSGTLNVAGAVALAAALADRVANREALATQLREYRDRIGQCAANLDGYVTGINKDRLPHIAHVVFPGADPEALLLGMDMAQIACSTGSACSAGVHRPSHVLEAMGLADDASSALRFSLGFSTTTNDIDAIESALGRVVSMARGVR